LVKSFSGGVCRLFFFGHFGSGFQIVGFSNLGLSFHFSVWHWSKFFLIVACNYSAYFLVKSIWRKFFSSALFLVNFAGFLNRLGFVGKTSSLVKSGFQNWVNFFCKSFGKFCFGFLVKFFQQGFCLAVLVLAKE